MSLLQGWWKRSFVIGWQGYVIGDWFPAANQVGIDLYSGTQDGGETIILLSLKKEKIGIFNALTKNIEISQILNIENSPVSFVRYLFVVKRGFKVAMTFSGVN